jgi:predicted phosphodiesterase
VVEKNKKKMSKSVTDACALSDDRQLTDSYRILVISDLHFREDTDVDLLLSILREDLKGDAFRFDSLNYLVIAGDLTSAARPNEYEKAFRFVNRLIEIFDIAANRCIIVPGNHDVDWEVDAYDWGPRRSKDTVRIQQGTWLEQGRLLGTRNDHYWQRFYNFSKCFYHPLMQREYPIDPTMQCRPQTFHTGLQFIPLNSSWEIDEFFPVRSGINLQALLSGLNQGDRDAEEMRKNGQFRVQELNPNANPLLRIGVWHHPVLSSADSTIKNESFINHLKSAGMSVAIFGHLHDIAMSSVRNTGERYAMNFIGVGTFGAGAQDRPESTPQMYTIIEIDQDLLLARVHVRSKKRADSVYQGFPVFEEPGARSMRQYYDIDLSKR